MKKSSLILGAIFVLGMFACKKENPQQGSGETGTTYMSVSINLPNEFRAGDKEDEKHNHIGEWEGRDDIKNIDIYLVAGGKVEVKSISSTNQTPMGGVRTAPFTTTGGDKTIYVVVNNKGDIKSALDRAATVGAEAFDKAYRNAYEVIQKNAYGAVNGDYANVEAEKDVIIMTGAPVVQKIKDGVPEDQADIQNKVVVPVRRLASRILVTKAQSLETEVKILATKGTEQKELGVLKDLKWTVAQYDKKSYLHSFNDKINVEDVQSPAHAFKPDSRLTYEAEARNHYDYSLLKDLFNIPVKGDLKGKEMVDAMKYITETTHSYAKFPQPSGYVRGNTTYVMVVGTFEPNQDVFAEGEAVKPGKGDGTIYFGTRTGLFYKDEAAAKAANGPDDGKKDGVIEFKQGKMFYFAWINPDDNVATRWNSSPVIRNNIYNVNVIGFSKYGFSGNPYNPDPNNPDNPDPDDPTPDPKDPIYDKETYMTTEITVIKWGTHSYDITF